MRSPSCRVHRKSGTSSRYPRAEESLHRLKFRCSHFPDEIREFLFPRPVSPDKQLPEENEPTSFSLVPSIFAYRLYPSKDKNLRRTNNNRHHLAVLPYCTPLAAISCKPKNYTHNHARRSASRTAHKRYSLFPADSYSVSSSLLSVPSSGCRQIRSPFIYFRPAYFFPMSDSFLSYGKIFYIPIRASFRTLRRTPRPL